MATTGPVVGPSSEPASDPLAATTCFAFHGEYTALEAFPYQLHRDAWGRLVLTDASGAAHVGVEPVRGFPITGPNYGLSLLDVDGRELAWIEDLDALPDPVRSVLKEELPRREFMPRLRRVVRVSGVAEPTEWDVETDRGLTRFVLKSEDDVRRLAGGRALIVDAHGIRYLIEDLNALDSLSRRVLERYL